MNDSAKLITVCLSVAINALR